MNQYMNRPMFQTPQMREGAGIMAGVAPIRGYADGDEVSDDDRSERLMAALSDLGSYISDKGEDFGEGLEYVVDTAMLLPSGIASLLGDAYEEYSPEELQAVTEILGEYLPDYDDYFEEDFIDFSPSEYKLGTGEERMNLRDITDMFYDPSSTFDNALLGLAATGVGATPAMLAKIGKSGVKGTKLLNRLLSASGAASRKAIPQGTLERLGRMQAASGIGSGIAAIPKGFAEGLDESDEIDSYANGGIVHLVGGGFLGDLGKIFGNKLGRLFRGDRGKLDELELEPPPKPIKSKDKKKDKEKEKEEEVTTTTTVTDDVIEESMGMPKKKGVIRKSVPYAGGAGLFWLGNKLIDSETNEEVDETKLAPENIPPKPDEEVIVKDDEVESEDVGWLDKTFSRLRSGVSKAWDSLDDPRVRAGLMAAAKPVEGYTPVNALVAASEGARAYDLEQAQLAKLSEDAKSDMEQLVDFYMTSVDTEGMSPQEIREARTKLQLTLFQDQERQRQQAAFMELAKIFGTTEEGLNALNEVAKQYGGSLTPQLAKILSSTAGP